MPSMPLVPTMSVDSAVLANLVSAAMEPSARMLMSVRMARTRVPLWPSVRTNSAVSDALAAIQWTTIKPDSLATVTHVRILTSARRVLITVPMSAVIVPTMLVRSLVPVPRGSRVMARSVLR